MLQVSIPVPATDPLELDAAFLQAVVTAVLAGATALALFWSALVLSRGVRLRPVHLLALLVPVAWSYVAIYQLNQFLLAALPMVLFLSAASIWTGLVFLDYRRQVGAPGAAVVGTALLLWGLHHLDYPILRAQGAWAPWGYYLDIIFELAVGAGFVIVVQIGRAHV